MPRLSLDRLGQASLLSALPVRIPGCVLWLDAGSLRLTSGDAVGTWTDLSGNGNHATQATAGNKPKYLETADFLTSTEYGTLEFTAPDLITRTTGSWVTDGYNSAGRILTVSGAATAANNGKFTIESATATVLTIAELTLADEVASTTETVKTNILNGRPVVRFDGEDDYLDLPNLMAGTTAGTALVVVKIVADPPSTDTKAGPPFGDFGSDAEANYHPFPNGTIYDDFGTTARKVVGDPATSLASWHIYTVISAPNDWRAYINGALFYSTATNVVGWSLAPFIGRSSNARLDGDVAEPVVYSRALADAERQRLERYLSRKYAIALAG